MSGLALEKIDPYDTVFAQQYRTPIYRAAVLEFLFHFDIRIIFRGNGFE